MNTSSCLSLLYPTLLYPVQSAFEHFLNLQQNRPAKLLADFVDRKVGGQGDPSILLYSILSPTLIEQFIRRNPTTQTNKRNPILTQ